MNKLKEKFILSWHSNWRFKSFALGLSLSSQESHKLKEGYTFDSLNNNDEVSVIKFREYYILFLLGFWQFSIGFNKYKGE